MTDQSPKDRNSNTTDQNRPAYLEIDTTLARRRKSWLAFLTFFVVIASLFVLIFIRFTGSVALAILLVAIMISYMAIMGYLASRNLQQRDGRD